MDRENIYNEKLVFMNEFNWFLKNNVQMSMIKLQNLIQSGYKMFEASENDKLVRPPKFILSGNQNVRCVVTLETNLITNAEISLKVIRPQPSIVTLRIMPTHSYMLEQINDCQNYLLNVLTLLDMHGQELNFKSTNEAIYFLDQLVNLMIVGRNCLTMPNKKSLNSIINHQNYKCFNQSPPIDNVLNFYINGTKLCLAIYQIAAPQHKGQQSGVESLILLECFVQKFSDVLLIFTQCLSICSDLKDKLKLFKSIENQRISTEF